MLGLLFGQAWAVTISNTATVSFSTGPVPGSATSNTVTIETIPLPSPSAVEFMRYAPGSPGSTPTPADGGSCQDGMGVFTALPPVTDSAGNTIDTTLVPVLDAASYQLGEAVFVSLLDANRNLDPAARDFIDLRITSSTGDEEVLRLQETGIDTGLFLAAVQSVAMPPAATRFDCRLSVLQSATLQAAYTDELFPADTAQANVLVESFSIAFDSSAGLPVNGVTVTLIDFGSGLPAMVFGVDGTSSYPATVTSGATVTDSGGRVYTHPPGGFQFPVVAAGNYILQLTPPAGYSAPSTVPLAVLQGLRDPAGNPYVVGQGSFGDVFNRPAQPGFRVDVPIDPVQSGLVLQKSASTTEVSAGEFLQYRLTLRNLNTAGAVADVQISDTLPAGMRYQAGSLRIAGQSAPDPALSADGRTLTILVGILGAGEQIEISYVVQLGAGARAGEAINSATATGSGGLASGVAQAAVRIRDPFFTSQFTIIGRVVEGECSTPWQDLEGVPGVRLLLDDGTYVPTDRDGQFHFEGVRPGTHVVQLDLDSLPADLEAIPCLQNSRFAGRAFSQFVEAQGGGLWRTDFHVRRRNAAVTGATGKTDADVAYEQAQAKRRAIVDDPEAAGAGTDWLASQTPDAEWLFPAPEHNPRAPTQRIVIKHAPGQTIVLRHQGKPVEPLNFDGVESNAAKSVSVSIWRGLPLIDGDNRFDADVVDQRGAVVARLTRIVHYANTVAQAVLVPEESVLVADGLHMAVIAVRLLDRAGRPVRAGVTGAFRLNPPYVLAQLVEELQQRQLAGIDRFAPTYQIEGDEGVAYIELAPTTESGSVVLGFSFPQDERTTRDEELRVWLEAKPRDWVLVGFAAGTVGYATLSGNMQSLAELGEEDGVYTDGQVSLYAKGRVLGKWLLTLAYDSDKPAESRRRESLLSAIDPDEFYTLYGDGTEQRYDAASAEKLYLKLERDQFYALVGDYETGLTQTQLSRYNRTLTGVKSQFHGEIVEATAFAADTAQNFARDEIQGNGTSGLYLLTGGGIVINGEKIRIEARDRFRSEVIIASRELLRHLDYDIDYDAGTLFFREPVPSRDINFNPVFIVAEYETTGTANKQLNAGGRVGARFLDGRLSAGASFIRDETLSGDTDLGGVDAEFRITPDTELRAEGATSRSRGGAVDREGDAYLAEIEHHSGPFGALAYVRRQATGFGVNQQSGVESGTFKAGVDAQLRLSENIALQGQAYRQENLASGATRDAASAELEYRTELWGVRAGALLARDEAITGERAESRQATLGANRSFFDQRLEVTAQGDLSLGGDNDSVDFPSRYQLGAAYAISEEVRLLAAYEITDGEAFDSSTSRLVLEVVPWKGARLSSTLNQSAISEYGPRTFALFGLTQSFLAGERWGFDVATVTSRTFDESGQPPLVINPGHPIASGGVLGNGALTEDFFAFSGGATYRSGLWSWTGRAETRDGETSDRHGFTTGFLRQARAGVAFAASAQAFEVERATGSEGLLANVSVSWAYRPLGRRWSILERLEFRHHELTNGTGLAGDGLFGNTSLTIPGDAKSRRLINNFVVNGVSGAWRESDTQGNLFELDQRNQWSLYYGSKYVFDEFDGADYSGYTDILGFEWRYDLTRRWDLGFRSSLLHAWDLNNYQYSAGPSLGLSPFDNAWFSVGYNLIGFEDRDFSLAHYTSQGPYFQLRFKFDQNTRPGPDGARR